MSIAPYQIGSGMSDSDLNTATWWVKHKLALRRAGYGTLIAFSIGCWGYAVWSYVDAYLISWPRESRIQKVISQQTVPLEALVSVAPEALQPAETQAFSGTDGRLDFLNSLTNPNTYWLAKVQFRFKVGEQVTETQTVTISPRSTRPLTQLGWKGSGNGELEVQSIEWKRIPSKLVGGNYDAFSAERQDFTITEPVFTSTAENTGQSDFTITNNSGYGYWHVPLVVTLLRQGVPLTINQVDLQSFKPNEARRMSLQWFDTIAGVDKVEVTPYVDILDPAAYLPSERI